MEFAMIYKTNSDYARDFDVYSSQKRHQSEGV